MNNTKMVHFTMTLANLKRILQPGAVLRLTYAAYAAGWREPDRTKLLSGEGLVRTVKVTQTNALAFETSTGDLSWLYWPPSKRITFNGEESFTVLDDDSKPSLTYAIESLPQLSLK